MSNTFFIIYYAFAYLWVFLGLFAFELMDSIVVESIEVGNFMPQCVLYLLLEFQKVRRVCQDWIFENGNLVG